MKKTGKEGVMAGTWSNSIGLLKASWKVLSTHRSLAVFPLLSGIASTLLIAAIMVPAAFLSGLVGGNLDNSWYFYLFLLLFYFLASFVVIFMNTGLVSCARVSLDGGTPRVSEGLGVAFGHLGRIAVWSLVNSTVGLVLRLIRDRGGFLGSIVAGLVAVAWNLITFFVIPLMIFQGLGVIGSIKESAGLFKRTWGENVIARFSIGMIFFLLSLLGIIPIVLVAFTGNAVLIVVVSAVVVLYAVALGILSTSLNGILSVALYDYATTGEVPSSFTPEAITAAFAPRRGHASRR